MDGNAIDIFNVSFGYRPDHDIFNRVNVSIPASAITAIIGKSGSGKSTLLQIINGMLRIYEGEIRLHGRPIEYRKIHALRLQIGYVVQGVGLFPHMTISENICILGKIAKKPKLEIMDRVEALMEMVQLPLSYLKGYPHELSGGEQQRVGLCRALLLKPPIVLMDEPFASLDGKTKKGIYHHLLQIQKKERRTIVLVTHDWEETAALADHFIWIEDGKVKARGDKSALAELKDTYFAETG